jgi:glutathione S-transferase
MDYLNVEEARQASGIRLVLTAGVPGPWGESAKQIFRYKGISYLPVAQHLFQVNAELRDWTGLRNAPVVMVDEEPPCHGWKDILMLAERLAPDPPLLARTDPDRTLALELSGIICGKDGFGWNRRLTLFSASRTTSPLALSAAQLQRDYGSGPAAEARAPGRVAELMSMLAAHLHGQHARGSRYFVGERISACDIYWACFSMMVSPVRSEWAAVPEAVRVLYAALPSSIAEALDEILISHRDHVFETCFDLPLDF